MFVLIVGAGRVGSAVAKSALAAGHEVSVLDEDPLSHERLDAGQTASWEDAGGQFTVGTALEIDALIQAGIERAEVFIASTDGDNTNLIIAQIAQRRFGVEQGDRARDGSGARELVRRTGPAHDLSDQARDRDVRARARARARLSRVRDHRRSRQGRPQPRAGADRQGPRGHADRVLAPALPGDRGRVRALRRSTATRPSCGCSSAPASSAPTSSSR